MARISRPNVKVIAVVLDKPAYALSLEEIHVLRGTRLLLRLPGRVRRGD